MEHNIPPMNPNIQHNTVMNTNNLIHNPNTQLHQNIQTDQNTNMNTYIPNQMQHNTNTIMNQTQNDIKVSLCFINQNNHPLEAYWIDNGNEVY